MVKKGEVVVQCQKACALSLEEHNEEGKQCQCTGMHHFQDRGTMWRDLLRAKSTTVMFADRAAHAR